MASLDPRMPIGDILAEGLRAYGVDKDKRNARVRELLRLVGLGPEHASRYPAEFSGGPAPADRHRPGAGPSNRR